MRVKAGCTESPAVSGERSIRSVVHPCTRIAANRETSSLRKRIVPTHRLQVHASRLVALLAYASLLSGCNEASGSNVSSGATQARQGATRPNIIFVLSDDEDVALHAAMPKTKALLHDQGTTFDNAFVTYSLCCPSRATALRGQYPHSSGIEGNRPPTGGYEKFRSLGLDSSTIATWLKASGYRTALFGTFMNGYLPTMDAPAGWSEWYGVGAGSAGSDYTMNENGKLVRYGQTPGDFLVDVIAHKAADVIRRSAADTTPVFLYIAPFTPHGPSTPAPRHAGMDVGASLPRTPAFDEADVSDKPSAVRSRPRLAPQRIRRLETSYQRRVRSLQSVDDLVDSVVTALRTTGQLDNTFIIYMSDNGFHMGEHRLMLGKNTPYEHDIRVPLVVRGPGVPAGRHETGLVLNNDLAPTFAARAGVGTPSFVEGRSLLPLLVSGARTWPRAAFMVERRGGRDAQLEGRRQPRCQRVEDARAAVTSRPRTNECPAALEIRGLRLREALRLRGDRQWM